MIAPAMPIPRDKIKAVVFDYGNTLIEFAANQIAFCDAALGNALVKQFGPYDEDRFNTLRRADRRTPYTNGFVERRMDEICATLVERLYGRAPTDAELAALLNVRLITFVDCIHAPEYVDDLLARLGRRYKLALVSNYPCGRAIRSSLKSTRIDRHMQAVVVSGDEGVGHVKPHPRPFQTVLEQLNVQPHETLCIGDNWLADVQGAKRLGMFAAHLVQWDTPEKFDPQPGDHDADVVLQHLTHIERYV